MSLDRALHKGSNGSAPNTNLSRPRVPLERDVVVIVIAPYRFPLVAMWSGVTIPLTPRTGTVPRLDGEPFCPGNPDNRFGLALAHFTRLFVRALFNRPSIRLGPAFLGRTLR